MIPTVPNGATIDSLLLATSRLDDSRSPHGAFRQFYGSRHPHANPFARHAATLSANAFAGLISPEQLILNHSAWPIYSSLVSQRSAQAWFQCTRDGEGHAISAIQTPVSSELFGSRWKSCGDCVDLHRHNHGTGHWMVIHQLPGIGICPMHGKPLDLECGVCGAALGGASMNRLPGEPCAKCGAGSAKRAQTSGSAGERELARLYSNLLDGQAMDFDMASRELLLRSAKGVLLKSHPGTSLEQFVLSSFNCRAAEDLGRYLNVAVSTKLLRLAAAGSATNAVPAPLHLAVLAVAIAHLEHEGYLDQKGQVTVDLPSVGHDELIRFKLSRETMEELLAHVSDSNISTVAVMALLSGEPATSIESKGLATVSRLKRFLKSLPELLAVHFPRPRQSRAQIAPRGATLEERRSINRDQIQRKIDAGARNRVLLLSSCGGPYKWALKFDRDWLDVILPAWSRSKR